MKKLLWLVPVALLVVNCGGGGGSVMPLTVGNTWDYQAITVTDFVDTMVTDMADTTTAVTEITAETTLDDSTEVFEVVSTTTVDTATTYVDTGFVLDNGDFVLTYNNKADTDPDTTIAYPLEDGKTWNVNADMSAVVLGKADVTVTAGTYNDCWEIGYITDSDTTHTFLAEKTGTVKTTFSHVVPDTLTSTMTSELTDVNVQ
jgi:hypothetical protein